MAAGFFELMKRTFTWLPAALRERGIAPIDRSARPVDAVNEGRQVIFVGAFREFAHDGARTLAGARGRRANANKEAVVRYLRSGKLLVFSEGPVRDIFDAKASAGTLSILTDGTYAWYELLAYYVARYDIALRHDFEAHVVRNSFVIPDIDLARVRLPPDDERREP